MSGARTLVRCESHRARQKLQRLLGDELGDCYFTFSRNGGRGGLYRIPAARVEEALEITGVKRMRDGDDIMRCWST